MTILKVFKTTTIIIFFFIFFFCFSIVLEKSNLLFSLAAFLEESFTTFIVTYFDKPACIIIFEDADGNNIFLYCYNKKVITFVVGWLEGYYTKEEKYIKFICYDGEFWPIVDIFVNEYKLLHKDELVSVGLEPQPEDEDYFLLKKFTGLRNFVIYLNEKYDEQISDNKMVLLRNLIVLYVIDYETNKLHIYDLIIYDNEISLVELSEEDIEYFKKNYEYLGISEIMEKKRGYFDGAIEENQKKKKT